MKKILILFFVFSSVSCFAQFSKTHYIPPLTASSNNIVNDHYIYISTPNTNNVNFKIFAIGGAIISGVVSNSNPINYLIGSGNSTQLFTPKTIIGKISNKGYIIEADDLVYVSIRTNAGGGAHAGGLVSKGNSALGTLFRLGAMLNPNEDASVLNFASILATVDNTKVTISNMPVGTKFADLTTYTAPIVVTLNKNESYVLALENYTGNNTPSNSSKMIGALVESESDKPVVVNSGSFGGSNSSSVNGQGAPNGRDVGFDQIVSFEKTGKEYIFVRGVGTDELERVLLIAQNLNTIIYLNDNLTTPFITLANPGDKVVIDGSQFINGNLYVKTSENVFAYQSIGGSAPGTPNPNGGLINPDANQNLFFVPPINCATPNTVDNIPLIQKIGTVDFKGTLNIVTETGALVKINGVPTTETPISVTGNPGFVRYTINDLSGNISIKSTKQVYVSYFGFNVFATYGGYYSGFDLKPEIVSDIRVGASSSCIPDVVLKINTLSSYDTFQWYFNSVAIDPILHPDAITRTYKPDAPGYYYVKGAISGCPSTGFVSSDEVPVSECPTNIDGDLANDNVDIDNDNDGILNCTESFGDQNIDVSNSAGGNINVNTYSNSFTGLATSKGTGSPIGTFTGSADGSFVTEIPAGKANSETGIQASSVTYTMNFTNPMSAGIEYGTPNSTDLLNADAEYVVNSDLNKTITVLNPDNQLLIDTNYDGIYETGITEYSSFEIRFRLNSTTPLAAGTGTFKFLTYLANSISFTHKNLSDTTPNRVSLKFFAPCIPKDSDLDGTADQLDPDSDNDGIADFIEAQANNTVLSNSDTNSDGLDNVFELGFTPLDTDNDGVLDYLDLDSDNDGIYDLVESGSNAADTDLNGIIDGNSASYGANGLSDSIETSADSGIFNYTIADNDIDGIRNFRDLDSDLDSCSDVIEAGFIDPDNDGKFGNSPITVDSNGLIIGAPYTTPNANYLISAPIIITTQPNVPPTCELQNATITLVDNGNTYQWQISIDNGTNWTDILNNAPYSGATTNNLSITTVTNAMNGYKYRVVLNKTGNSCGLTSAETTLTIYVLPVVNDITIIQCDDDSDLKTIFNLTIKNNSISANSVNETFRYYKTPEGADIDDVNELISNYTTFPNTTSPMDVWARVANKITGCYSVAKLTLVVAASKISPAYSYIVSPVCDDTLAADGTLTGDPKINKRDGISAFDLTNAIKDVESQLPPPLSNYTFKYYRNKADALAQNDVNGNSLAIKPIEYTNFRNDIPYTQNIWVRVNNNLTSDCGDGFGDYIKLSVEKLPFANAVSIQRQCDDNQDGIFTFNTVALESTFVGTNQSFPVTVTYFDAANNPLKDANGVLITSPFPATFTTASQTIKAVVTNNTTQKCFDETLIVFTVDDLPEAFAVPSVLTTTCDDELDPLVQDGKFAFDTSSFQFTILGTQTGMTVKYFDGNGKSLPSPLPNPFVTGTQNVKVVVENPINPTCTASIAIPFIVEPLPNINLNTDGSDDELVCSNLPTFFVQLNAGIQDGTPTSNYTYIWSKDGTILSGKTAYTLDVNEEGVYTVEVTNGSGCTSIRTINVTASDVATIQTIDIVDMSDVNTVTVNVTGAGDYEYSLDEASGYFQDSNFFTNVPAGIHEVFINDKNGCGAVSKVIAVVGLPKFFTPNNDGYNDYWNVKGINATFNANSIIYIFDRYGKLLKQLQPSKEGWDGTFNGTPLPSDDYWYTVKLEDGREAKGHFSLKR